MYKIEIENGYVESVKPVIKQENGITCSCDNPSLRMTMHLDGSKFYQYNYCCNNCGNQIAMVKERDFYWE